MAPSERLAFVRGEIDSSWRIAEGRYRDRIGLEGASRRELELGIALESRRREEEEGARLYTRVGSLFGGRRWWVGAPCEAVQGSFASLRVHQTHSAWVRESSKSCLRRRATFDAGRRGKIDHRRVQTSKEEKARRPPPLGIKAALVVPGIEA